MEWLKQQGPWCPGLIDYLQRQHHQYDVLVFFTYLYAPAVLGLRIAPSKSILVPTAHDEPAIRLENLQGCLRVAGRPRLQHGGRTAIRPRDLRYPPRRRGGDRRRDRASPRGRRQRLLGPRCRRRSRRRTIRSRIRRPTTPTSAASRTSSGRRAWPSSRQARTSTRRRSDRTRRRAASSSAAVTGCTARSRCTAGESIPERAAKSSSSTSAATRPAGTKARSS